LGDDLIESFPCFIVSENLKNKIDQRKLTGFKFDDAEITKLYTFSELHAKRTLSKFYWLKITGKAGQHDFGIASDFRLVVSSDALFIIKRQE